MKGKARMLQRNLTTGIAYKGRNQVELLQVKAGKKYTSDNWLTFVQAMTAHRKLVNAKGCGVHLRTFTKEDKANEKTGNPERFSRPINFVVFNEDLLVKVGA